MCVIRILRGVPKFTKDTTNIIIYKYKLIINILKITL